MELYHEMELGQTCWINNYPEGCEYDETVHCQARTIAWVFGGPILIFAYSSIPINNILIILYIRKRTIRHEGSRTRSVRKRSDAADMMPAVFLNSTGLTEVLAGLREKMGSGGISIDPGSNSTTQVVNIERPQESEHTLDVASIRSQQSRAIA